MELAQIRQNYAKLQDYKIENLATYEAADLEPEVISILEEEIDKRKLDPDLKKAIAALRRELTDEELSSLKNKISHQPSLFVTMKVLRCLATKFARLEVIFYLPTTL